MTHASDAPRALPTTTPPASASPSNDAFHSSGQSPGARSLHLIGPGQVGRAFLRLAANLPLPVVAVTDSTATAFDRRGLPIDALLAHKAAGHSLATWPRAERLPTEVAIDVVGAGVVVDATPTTRAGTDAAVARGRVALRNGSFLALCGKNALAEVAPDWLLGRHRARVGIDAVLGGAGRQLLRELDELRAETRAVALVGNVTTTVIVQAIEQGASVEQGIDVAQERGLLEPDATLDLDGSDAATKLRAVWGAVFGEAWSSAPAFDGIERHAVAELDPELLRARRSRGATTRLVARGSRAGGDLRVAFEELSLGSPLAAPPDRVVYVYELLRGLRVHTGLALGYERTAAALLGDVRHSLAAEVAR